MSDLADIYYDNKNKGSVSNTGNTNVLELIENNAPFFKMYYADELSQKQAMETALRIGNDPKLTKCTPTSIVKAIMDSVRLGLDATSGINHTWIIPYNNANGPSTAQLQISSKGYTQLLYRAGWLIETKVVYKCDAFQFKTTQNGDEFEFSPNMTERKLGDKDWVFNNFISVIVIATDGSGRKIIDNVDRSVIEKLRMGSHGQIKANKYTSQSNKKRIAEKLPVDIWFDWYEEMAMAKSIKKHAKRLPLGDKAVLRAFKMDDMAEIGNEAGYIAEAQLLGTEPLIDSARTEDAKIVNINNNVESQNPKPEQQHNIAQNKNALQNPETNETIILKPNQSTLDLMQKAKAKGFSISAPAKKKGKVWLKATPKANADYAGLCEIGFIKPKKIDFLICDVTKLMAK